MSTCNHPRGNTTIIDGFLVIGPEHILEVPNCVCACICKNYYMTYAFVVLHEDGNTIIKRLYCTDNGYAEVLLKDEGLVNIINIFYDATINESSVHFSTEEGIKYTFHIDGRRLDTRETICGHKRIPNVVGCTFNHYVSYDGHIIDKQVTGYNIECCWNKNVLECAEGSLTLDSDISDACTTTFQGNDIAFVLSESKIIIHFHTPIIGKRCSTELEGEWTRIIVHKGIVYGVDKYYVMRDLRCVWDQYSNLYYPDSFDIDVPREMLYSDDPSPYELGNYDCKTIGILHGMRLMRKMIKGAHNAYN